MPIASFINKLLSSICPLLKCTKNALLKNPDGRWHDKLKPHICVNSKKKKKLSVDINDIYNNT